MSPPSKAPGIIDSARRVDGDQLRLAEIESQIAAIRKNPFRGDRDIGLQALMNNRHALLVRLGLVQPGPGIPRPEVPQPEQLPPMPMPKPWPGEPL